MAGQQDERAHHEIDFEHVRKCLSETSAQSCQVDDWRQNRYSALDYNNLEKTYEIVEKALFKCIQRQDESNDSFLARCDVVWSELKAKKIDLDQVHAYIVLRGSLLSSEDKKRVIIESESASTGALTIEKVSQSVRMLGTSFFNDMIGLKKARGKIYDQQALLTEDLHDESSEGAALIADDLGEEEFLEQLLHDEDEDALLIADYEPAAADTLQSDEDLAAAFTSYSEARKRLSDRFKNRGFWPIGAGTGKGKSKNAGANKGKGRGYGRGPRKSLQQRIMESTCRNCGKRGHWRAECPDRQRAPSVSGTSSTSAAMTAEAVSLEGESNALPMEFIQLPVVHETTLDVPRLQVINVVQAIPHEIRERLRKRGKRDKNNQSSSPEHPDPRNDALRPKPILMQPSCDAREAEEAFFTSHGMLGILDTGATKSVVGSHHLPALIESFPPDLQKQLSRTSCEIIFRFGNQGTLDSNHALVIPLKSLGLGLKVAIVPGQTPLLLSNTLVRTLKASIDSARQVLTSPMLHQAVPLKLSPRGLYLLDLNDLVYAQKGQNRVIDRQPAETFMSSVISGSQNAEASASGENCAGSSDSVEAFKLLSLEEMGEHRITFGKTHVGRKYSEIWETEKGWVKWFSKVYAESQKDEHRKVLAYIEAMVTQHEATYELSPLQDTGTQQQVIAPKAKMGPKSKAAPAPAMSVTTEISEEADSWDPWDVMGDVMHNYPNHTAQPVHVTSYQQEINDALQSRILNVENALTEILNHVRQSNPAAQ
eukprot:s813_g4.t1